MSDAQRLGIALVPAIVTALVSMWLTRPTVEEPIIPVPSGGAIIATCVVEVVAGLAAWTLTKTKQI